MSDDRPELPEPEGDPVPVDADHGGEPTHDATPDPGEGFFETAVGVVTSPTATFDRIAERQPLAWSIVVVLVINALTAATQSAGFSPAFEFGDPSLQQAMPPASGVSGVAALLGSIFVAAPLGLAVMAVWVAVVLLFAKMLRGTGTYRSTFCGLAFAYVPQIFSVIVAALTIPFGFLATVLNVLVAVGIGIWTIVLSVIAVKQVHRLTTGRAVAAILLPIAALMLLVLLVVVAIVGALLTAL